MTDLLTNDPNLSATSEHAQRLADIKRQRDEMQQRKAVRDESQRLQREIEQESIKLKNDQVLECLESEHGALGEKIAAVFGPRGVVVVRKPNTILFRKWVDEGKTTTAASIAFVRTCVLSPDQATFDEWLEERPGMLASLLHSCLMLAGFNAEEVAGK